MRTTSMLRAVVAAALLMMPDASHAQADALPDTTVAGLIRTADDLKTGNFLDVLTNFFQLAAQDLSGDDKSFQFKSTLFGIKARVDSTLLIDHNVRRLRYARNLQFEVGLHTNEDFKPIGISGGITYALVNNRDRKRADFRNAYASEFNSLFGEFNASAKGAEDNYRRHLNDTLNQILSDIRIRRQALQDPTTSLDEKARLEEEIANFQPVKEAVVKRQRDLNAAITAFGNTGKLEDVQDAQLRQAYEAAGLPAVFGKMRGAYDSLMEGIANRGLLTMSINARTDSATSRFTEGNLQFIYLKGIDGGRDRRFQADLRAGVQAKDNSTPDGKYRFLFHAVGGANIIVFKTKRTHKSILEVKPNLEFRSILSKQYPEDENFFSFNMDVRLRVTDGIWIPFIVKYDVENQNLLGFLNVSANFSALSGLLGRRNDD